MAIGEKEAMRMFRKSESLIVMSEFEEIQDLIRSAIANENIEISLSVKSFDPQTIENFKSLGYEFKIDEDRMTVFLK